MTHHAPRIFITGATGLIGRALTARLITRGAHIIALVRPDTPRRRPHTLTTLAAEADAHGAHLELIEGDLTLPHLGIPDPASRLGHLDHVFHLAAAYDLDAPGAHLERINTTGTQHLLELLSTLPQPPGCLHHVSSIAIAGEHAGTFTEDDFDLGQTHPPPYHAPNFASQAPVRAQTHHPSRTLRPPAPVGHSRTGHMDRVDGPYHLFKAAQLIARGLPRALPLITSLRLPINMVPVDFVADALDAIAFAPDLDHRAFHLSDPRPPSFKRFFNALSRAAGGPRIRSDLKALRAFAPGALDAIRGLGAFRFMRRQIFADLHIPESLERAINPALRFESSQTLALLTESLGVPTPPRTEALVPVLYDYWQRHLDPDLDPDALDRRHFARKHVLITGGSSGVGAALAERLGRAGAHVLIAARRPEQLDTVAERIRTAGGTCHTYPVDLSDFDACDALTTRLLEEHGGVDILVNNAARSIRRPATESLERFHDYERVMRLNYFAPLRLIRNLLPAMRSQGHGHIVNVLTAGVVLPTPRFSAYGPTKAALGHFSDTLGAELLHENIHVCGVYLPWVRTPMMDATGLYEDTQALTPTQAADWIIQGILTRNPHVDDATTRRRAVLNRIAPRTVGRILNILSRIEADDPDAHPEFALDRALLSRFVKGRLL